MERILPRGILKSSPDTFVVQERVVGVDGTSRLVPLADDLEDEKTTINRWDSSFPLTIFELTKSRWSTEDALREVAEQFRTSFELVRCTGLKDKFALTAQLISVRGSYRPCFRHESMALRQVGGAHRLERHLANHFSILILTDAVSIDLSPARRFPNLYGPQRMGRPGSEQIGRHLFEGDFTKASEMILASPNRRKLEQAQALGKCSQTEALFHKSFRFSLAFELEKWQSWLWNQLLNELVVQSGGGLESLPERLPIWSARPDVVAQYRHLWDPKIGPTKWALELARPFLRPTTIVPGGLEALRKPRGWELNFDLPSGAYATEMLAYVFQLEERHL